MSTFHKMKDGYTMITKRRGRCDAGALSLDYPKVEKSFLLQRWMWKTSAELMNSIQSQVYVFLESDTPFSGGKNISTEDEQELVFWGYWQ